jgi:hypothetical protein
MKRREWAVAIKSPLAGLTVPLILRLDGDPAPGAVVTMQARALATGGWIPAKWATWSKPRPVTLSGQMDYPLTFSNQVGSVEATVRLSPDFKTIGGEGTAKVIGVPFALTIQGLQTAEMDITPTTTITYVLARVTVQGPEVKCASMVIRPDGTILQILYRNSPRGLSWLYRDGRKIADIEAETAHLCLTGDGRVWLAAEHGQAAEIVGNQVRPLGFETDFCGLALEIEGEPMWFDNPTGSDSIYVTNRFGKKVNSYRVKGIPYDGAAFPDGRFCISVADGANKGLVWSNGQYIACNARGVGLRGSEVLAGVDGRLMRVGPTGLIPTLVGQRLGDSIDSIATDDQGNTWLSVSSPDALVCWRADGELQMIKEIPDASDGGALFRGRVAVRGEIVAWARNTRPGNGTELWRASASGEPVQPPSVDEPSPIEWWSALDGIEAWPAVGTLAVSDLGSSTGRFIPSPALSGTCWLCWFVKRDGRWVGGEIDGINSTGQVKTISNAVSKDKGGPLPGRYGPNDEATDRKYLRATKGEQVAFCLASSTTKTRTALTLATWQDSTWSAAEPEPEKPPVNKGGGDGLYKPETRLWLLPAPSPRAPQIRFAAEYRPGGALVKHLRIGTNDGARADGKQTPTDKADFYHNGRLVFRDAVVSANGNSLIAWTHSGKKYQITIQDRLVRQEGKGA